MNGTLRENKLKSEPAIVLQFSDVEREIRKRQNVIDEASEEIRKLLAEGVQFYSTYKLNSLMETIKKAQTEMELLKSILLTAKEDR